MGRKGEVTVDVWRSSYTKLSLDCISEATADKSHAKKIELQSKNRLRNLIQELYVEKKPCKLFKRSDLL